MTARALLLALLFAGAGVAQEEAVPVRRHVLALLPGAGPDEYDEDIVHSLLEMPINHLGFVVDRHFIQRGPPSRAQLDRARAVLTCFDDGVKGADWLWPWLEKEVASRDVRVVHFHEFGPLAEDPKRLDRWLRRFGLSYDDTYLEDPLYVQVKLHAGGACRYEADPRRFACHRGPHSASKANRVWVETFAHGKDARHPLVTGPWGGVALAPWTYNVEGTRQWHVDPFTFLGEALGARGVPAPHPSVLNGRRMFFVQIDGDGFESISTVRKGQYAAQVMLDDVLKKYELPFTVSIIVRSLTRDYAVAKPTKQMLLAREILNLENVEVASHGVLHTLEWQKTLSQATAERAIVSYAKLANYEYSPSAEVRKSVRFINERLVDEGRRCRVMLWTGIANPGGAAVRATVEAGCWNLNGGVFRWDVWHDSVGYVSPWSRSVGGALQVYAGAANENDFEGFFTTMPGSFKHISQTIERTGARRILKPADVYIHFYSAERPARLRSIHQLLERWTVTEPTAPVFASTYCAAVHAAVTSAKIARTKTGWRLRDFGGCRTVRIDGGRRDVHLGKSKGLLGYKRDGRSLYLHLAAAHAEVVLAEAAPARPHVREANCLLTKPELTAQSVTVTATAHCRRVVILAGFPANRLVVVEAGARRTRDRTDADGRVTVELDAPGTTRIAVRLR